MAEKFTKVDIDLFLRICKDYNACEYSDDTNVNLDLVKRVIILEQEINLLKSIIQREIKPKKVKDNAATPDVVQKSNVNLISDEQMVVNIYKETGSINKTTEAIFGMGKKGKYYADKVKPILFKYSLIK